MSRFFSEKYRALTPYTPGEQPRDTQYVKLNTNESPFPPSPLARRAAAEAAENLRLYSDPDCTALTAKLAALCGVGTDGILCTNGSDEILNFAFMAFCDAEHPAFFPNITYGFYPVAAALNFVPYKEIPLREDFTVDPADYAGLRGLIVLANPNAPTGLTLAPSEIEGILRANPESVVLVDEAYVDFGAESVLPLIGRYDNLLVAQTFSKSRSMAGARLGFGAGCPELIRDLNTIKYATNPYNVNSMTMAAGLGALRDEDYTRHNCRVIQENRAWTAAELRKLGFTLTDSRANFLFARHPAIGGGTLYQALKARGVLVRHFTRPEIGDYIRVSIGSKEQMARFLDETARVLEARA